MDEPAKSFSQLDQTARPHCPQWSTWTLLTPPVLDQSMLQQTNTAADTAKPKVFIAIWTKTDVLFSYLRNIWTSWGTSWYSVQGWMSIAIWVCSSFYQNIVEPSLYMFLKFIHHQFCPFMPTLESSILAIFVTFWLGYEKSQVVKLACRFCLTCFWETLNRGHNITNPSNAHVIRKNHPENDQQQICINFDPPQKRGEI